MNYEQRYKEALKAVKELQEANPFDDGIQNWVNEKFHTFDFEKKEFNKIEPFNEFVWLTDFKKTLTDICIGWIGEEHGWKQYIKDNADVLLKIAIEKFNSVQDTPFEQKHAEWSEEDENMVRYIGNAITCKESAKYLEEKGVDMIKAHRWLESFRPQPHWKPSQEQMEALKTSFLYWRGTTKEVPCAESLESLYEQLKQF